MRRRDQIITGVAVFLLVLAAYVIFQDRRIDFGGGDNSPAPIPPLAGVGPSAATAPSPSPYAATSNGASETAVWEGYADETAGFEIQYPSPNASRPSDPEKAPVALPDAPGPKPRMMRIDVVAASDPRLDKSGCADTAGGAGQLIGQPTTGSIDGADYCLATRDVSLVDGRLRSYIYAVKLKSGGRAVITFTIKFMTQFMVRAVAGCEQDVDQTKPQCRILNFDETRDTDLFGRVLKTLTLAK